MVLQAIRERLTGFIAVFIFTILIIPFAFVGVNSYFTSDAVNNVARVNEAEITVTQFSQGFQNYRNRMQSILGENFDAEQFDQPIVRRQFLDSLIDQELLNQVSAEAGLSVDNGSLAQAIREIGAFQVAGVFNEEVYQARLTAQGDTPKIFEQDMRARLVMDQFPENITSSAIATEWELNQYVRLQDQQRTFKTLLVPAIVDADESDRAGDPESEEALASEQADESDQAAESTGVAEFDEAEMLAWYEANPDLYRSEEQVIIEYVELNAAVMEGDVQPDDDQLRNLFEEQKIRFVTPEAREASHILIEVAPDADDAIVETARQLAEELAERARAGEEFATLATENSQDAGSSALGGDLGWIEPGFMVQAFEDGLYALQIEKPISDPIQTGFGWHVILLMDIRPAEGMTFEEARQTLLDEYNDEQQERQFIEQADRLVDLIYEDPTTLEAAANELDLTIETAGPFSRSGGPGVAANPDVVTAAFSDLVLQQASVSDPIDLGDNHIVMIRLSEHIPEDIFPIDEVRDSVIASIKQRNAMQAASDRADEVLRLLEEGADIAGLAEQESLELLESEAVVRTDRSVPTRLLKEVFLLSAPADGSSKTAVVSTDDGYAVVQLENVVDGEVTEENVIATENYRYRIANASANAEAVGFLRMLKEQSEIEVFEDRL
jgi:peptidyl-prolyl cis-trans isomerase D